MELGLKGRRIAILAADGSDVGQLQSFRRSFTDAGSTAHVVGAREGPLAGDAGGGGVVDRSFDVCHAADYDALVVPGGDGARALRGDSRARQFVKEFMAADKPVAAVGEGVELLVASDVVAGRTIAASDKLAGAIRGAGGTVVQSGHHIDDKLVTGQGSSDIGQLSAVLLREFANRVDEARVDQLSEQSFPASDPPPGPVAVGGEGASKLVHLDPGRIEPRG
jgi:protease I